jgi:putative nucleotidyltransferase with HDIG domain
VLERLQGIPFAGAWRERVILTFPSILPTMSSASALRDQLLPISIKTLSRSLAVGINIYICLPSGSPVLFSAADDVAAPGSLERTIEAGIATLYIAPYDREHYQQYLRENWRALAAHDCDSTVARIAVISEVIRDVLSDQFANGTTESIVDNCQSLGTNIASVLGNDSVIVGELGRVLHHDYGTFTHSANVAAYAVLLGRALGFCEPELAQLATGALLHDIGKLDVDSRILNKPGRLDEFELREMRRHPTNGLERVAGREDLQAGQCMMIYQHHERCDGSGYPVGCDQAEIHPWARLCAIVDVFEALTSLRPYRAKLTHEAALTILNRGCGTEFDKEMLECWHKIATI